MKTAKTLMTTAAALGLSAGVALAQDVDVEEKVYMTDETGQLYEVTLVEIEESDIDPQVSHVRDDVSERAEELGAEAEDIEGQERLVLTEFWNTERAEEQVTNGVREVETFEDEQAEDEMIDEDAAR